MLTSDCGEATLAINPLDRPVFFREFLKMLNVGLDPTYDVDLIQDLCRSFNIEESSVSNVRRWRVATGQGNAKCPQDLKREAAAAWRRFVSCVRSLAVRVAHDETVWR